ncbi:hypothetical protein D3C83_132800 [compost metagenome]
MLPIMPLNSMSWTSRGVRSTTSHFAAWSRSWMRSASHSGSVTLVFFQAAAQSALLKGFSPWLQRFISDRP